MTNASGDSPTNWFRGGWGTNTSLLTYPVAGDGDSAAVKAEITSYTDGDVKWYFQDVNVTAGTTYTYTDRYQSNTVTHLIARYNTNGSFSYVYLAQINASSSWNTASVDLTIPSGVQSVTIFHLINSVGWLTTDNASLIAKPVVTFAQGMVSLDFDDGWLSTFQNGIPILDAAGYKSTQYIITGYMQNAPGYVTADQVKQMAQGGHDIEAHTRTHPDLTTLTAAQLQNEIAGSKTDLQAIGITAKSLAYPYGTYNSQVIQAVKDAGFQAARTALAADGGFNTKDVNHYLLKTFDVEQSTTLADIQTAVDTAMTQKTWLIMVMHQVDNTGDQYSTSPAKLQNIVNYLKSKNANVVTVSQGLSALN
jgi:peptidoglycan/xylan/chitin deacetylase (PgdA/CDA1 family)